MPSQAEIAAQIVAALAVTIPDLDTSIGTPTRKIIDATAEPIAEAYVDQFFLGYQYDVDSRSGTDLDDFVNTFGMTRFAPRRATGVVTFATAQAAKAPVSIPAGTAVSTSSSPQVVFTTLITAILPIGAVSIDVPVIAQLGGSAGNVPPNSIANFATPLSGFSTLANTAATSGGSDAESDDALRNRFKNTVFRNMAGTEQMFLGVAQENSATVQANVIGAAKIHREQIQITGGTGQSTVQAAKYVYPFNYVFGPSIDGGNILSPGVHYTFSGTTFAMTAPAAPTLALITSGGSFANATARYYRIAWANGMGTTPASTEATTTTTATNQGVQLTLPTPPIQAQWVYIYGSDTTNTEVILAIVPTSQTTWTDNGSYTGSQAYPTTNTAGYAPTITSIDATNCPDGIYDLEFQYVPQASRNDPANGVTNKIDIYIQGDDEQQASETIVWSTSQSFNSTAGDPLNFTHFAHPDLTHPTSGNYFLPLTFAPVTALPATIEVAAVGGTPVATSTSTAGSIIYAGDAGTGNEVGSFTYYYGVDYFLVNDITSQGGSPHSRSGIEWLSPANGATKPVPPANALLPILYNYNAVPREVETAIQRWRLVTTDVWCHAAKQMLLNVNLIVVLAPGITVSSVQAAMNTAMDHVFSQVGFDGVLSTSEILTAAGQVSGVQAVRFVTQADASAVSSTAYAIQWMTSGNALVETFAYNGRAIDVYFADDTVPIFNQVNLTVRAFNTFQTHA